MQITDGQVLQFDPSKENGKKVNHESGANAKHGYLKEGFLPLDNRQEGMKQTYGIERSGQT